MLCMDVTKSITALLHSSTDKMMAVPYSASDTPKLRSEYSHPDMAIAYTCLSYCHRGLELSQF
jgi:hypothetical protein